MEGTFEVILGFGVIIEAVVVGELEVVGVMIVEIEIVTWIGILEVLEMIVVLHSETIEAMIEIGGVEMTASEDAERHRHKVEVGHQIIDPA